MQIQDESYIKWKLFLEGNDEAYSWLYTHHIQLLYQYGLQITPDTEVIKDCIQDVFIRIYKNKNKLSIPQNVKIYLMISLKNSIYNVFSKERSEESYAFNFYSMEEQYITENDFINEEERHTITYNFLDADILTTPTNICIEEAKVFNLIAKLSRYHIIIWENYSNFVTIFD